MSYTCFMIIQGLMSLEPTNAHHTAMGWDFVEINKNTSETFSHTCQSPKPVNTSNSWLEGTEAVRM